MTDRKTGFSSWTFLPESGRWRCEETGDIKDAPGAPKPVRKLPFLIALAAGLIALVRGSWAELVRDAKDMSRRPNDWDAW